MKSTRWDGGGKYSVDLHLRAIHHGFMFQSIRKSHWRWTASLVFGAGIHLAHLSYGQNYAEKAAESIRSLPGFEVELVYTVPQKEQGSWVAMTLDDKGRFIVSDQYGKLYRTTVPLVGQETDVLVEPISLEIQGAQGLVYAFGSLYAVVNSSEHQGRGLYRITDTDKDDQFDKLELLKKFEEQGGEHGPHAVLAGPDGKSLYVVVGNQTALPRYDHTYVPPVWGEDLLLPRVYGRGFMRGIEAPRGWIAKTDPEGENWESSPPGSATNTTPHSISRANYSPMTPTWNGT
ncbi:MAG: hypothetical protein LR011_00770 [Verrucomicrobia bacterium]|nr:hypothetical protein [Verrucomicrobiota bacterium]